MTFKEKMQQVFGRDKFNNESADQGTKDNMAIYDDFIARGTQDASSHCRPCNGVLNPMLERLPDPHAEPEPHYKPEQERRYGEGADKVAEKRRQEEIKQAGRMGGMAIAAGI
ncbi:MAG: hypothetical protein Q9216_006137 [Gyalolechia sp. 2 TL-2023]